MAVKILDLTTESANPPEKVLGPVGLHGRIKVREPWSIDSVVLHQTACVFGPRNDSERRWRRALGVPAHATAFRDGVAVLAHPLTWYLYHANTLNYRSLGLEIEGAYPGVPEYVTPVRDRTEVSDSTRETPCTELLVETARVALQELVRRGREQGMPIRYIFAHRQSSGTRRSDPGWELWDQVALWAEKELGLLTTPHHTEGKGRPIPVEWDVEKGVGRF